MAKKKRKKPQRGGGQPIKGFRPGKEPPKLRKQRAKARLGPDASWAQKQMVEAVGDRSPEEVRRMLRRWGLILALVGALLVVAGIPLYSWAVWAGALVHALAAVVLFLYFRIRRQGTQLVTMSEEIGR
jgi:Flp pilus assembly protein TadB